MSHSKESGKSWRLDDMYIGFVQSETRYLDIPIIGDEWVLTI